MRKKDFKQLLLLHLAQKGFLIIIAVALTIPDVKRIK
jgi:hypothetical protein